MGLVSLQSLLFLLHFFLLSLFLFFVNSIAVQHSTPPCPPFNCGSITNISFPFADIHNPRCGLILIECVDNMVARIPKLDDRSYLVKSISNSSDSFTVQDLRLTSHLRERRCDLISKFAPPISPNLRLRISEPNLTIFICNSDHHLNLSAYPSLRHYNSCDDWNLYFSRPGHESMPNATKPDCPSVSYPLLHLPNVSEWENFDLSSSVVDGFPIHWVLNVDCVTCENSGGQCGLDNLTSFSCYCKDGNFGKDCTSGITGESKIILKIVIGFAALVGMLLLTVFLLVVWRWKFQLKNLIPLWKKPKHNRGVEKLMIIYGTQMPRRYSYSNVNEMTNFLKNKLGEGGCYGNVFKGQLSDSHFVAVKILRETKGEAIDFINKVVAISRLDHINVVELVGFCYEGSKRALIYDFMPNGSLDKFIYAENPKHGSLGSEKLFQIALGIARGLEYLHGTCNMRILHFDIRPHNILLDQDFCPKISDFGLEKLCPNKQSFKSTIGSRGTMGYIAPESISGTLGTVSNKSDVYSYGILLLEMVNGRLDIDAQVNNTSEIYFPKWMYNQIDKCGDLQSSEFAIEKVDEFARKMIMVGLWCILTKPANRPTMSKVVEMLEGNHEGLQIPPKPFLYSLESNSNVEISGKLPYENVDDGSLTQNIGTNSLTHDPYSSCSETMEPSQSSPPPPSTPSSTFTLIPSTLNPIHYSSPTKPNPSYPPSPIHHTLSTIPILSNPIPIQTQSAGFISFSRVNVDMDSYEDETAGEEYPSGFIPEQEEISLYRNALRKEVDRIPESDILEYIASVDNELDNEILELMRMKPSESFPKEDFSSDTPISRRKKLVLHDPMRQSSRLSSSMNDMVQESPVQGSRKVFLPHLND